MIRIFTDNAANLPDETVRKYGISIINLPYTVDGVEADENAPFDPVAFFGAMREGAVVRTSMPSPGKSAMAMEEVLENGDDVICICLSGGISGTYGMLCSAAKKLKEKYPEREIRIIDAKGASLGEGQHAVEAAVMRDEGKTVDEICEHVYGQIERMNQYFVVDNIRYIKKTGRIWGGVSAALNVLTIKPILFGNEEGHIVVRGIAKGRKRAVDKLAALYAEKHTNGEEPVGIAEADCPEDAERLVGLLREAGQTGPINVVGYEPVTGSHVGPGTIALFFYGNNR